MKYNTLTVTIDDGIKKGEVQGIVNAMKNIRHVVDVEDNTNMVESVVDSEDSQPVKLFWFQNRKTLLK